MKLFSSLRFSLFFCVRLLYELSQLSYELCPSWTRLQSFFLPVFSFYLGPLLNQLQCQYSQQHLITNHLNQLVSIFQQQRFAYRVASYIYIGSDFNQILLICKQMQITKPKKRGLKIQEKLRQAVKKTVQKSILTFPQYCQLSLYCIEEVDDFFVGPRAQEKYIRHLLNIELNYIPKKQRQLEQEQKKQEQQARNIMKILTYAWKNIIALIKGRKEESNDRLGIYSQENINIHFARLEEMLLQLKSKKYRCGVYLKQHAYSREIAEKELEEQLVFVKLLQHILKTQTQKIEEERANHKKKGPKNSNQPPHNQEEVVLKKIPPISSIINVSKYFQKKYSNNNTQTQVKDPIDLLQQKRRFNSAVLRYHLQNSDRK